MRIGIIGAGRIGANAARMFALAGHDVLLSFARDRAALEGRAAAIGPPARAGDPREAAAFGEVVMLAVPWGAIDEALTVAGPLAGKVVIDTTNQFGPGGPITLPGGVSAAAFNARRMPDARQVKAFNTLTAGFQATATGRARDDRAALFLAGEDAEAKRTVAGLIEAIGFAPADVGGWGEVWIMEAPRRPGSVYGEEYRPEAARRIAAAVRDDPTLASRLADELKTPS